MSTTRLTKSLALSAPSHPVFIWARYEQLSYALPRASNPRILLLLKIGSTQSQFRLRNPNKHLQRATSNCMPKLRARDLTSLVAVLTIPRLKHMSSRAAHLRMAARACLQHHDQYKLLVDFRECDFLINCNVCSEPSTRHRCCGLLPRFRIKSHIKEVPSLESFKDSKQPGDAIFT